VAEKEGFGTLIPHWLGYTLGAVVTAAVTVLFFRYVKRVEN
jgi:hypothetical protein